MEFIDFKLAIKKQFSKMSMNMQSLFLTHVNKDELWEKYLDSFPDGTNEIFRERRNMIANVVSNL